MNRIAFGRPRPHSGSGSKYFVPCPTSCLSTHLRSLKHHTAIDEVNDMFDMGAETLALPLSEKMKFEQGDEGDSFGSVFPIDPATLYLISYPH